MSLFQTPNIAAKCKLLIAPLIASLVVLSGCSYSNSLNLSQVYKEGYILDQSALDSISIGSSQEQVLLSLGSPSLKAKYDNEVFYYISQIRYRRMQFMKTKIVDRKVLAIYFDNNNQVERIANYGLQDGRVFDFITQTTPTSSKDQSFLMQFIRGF
ncbi:hypothetical protein H704_00591 [Bartonella bacilliformis Peru38]|uniref:SmpA/OmlA family outer membrane protein n=2 Tax=Bartonella bacilliformis TaxID=774 RepID=A0ABP2SMT3_BARBA|nr:outer membrane protein assembly factor BamE [Bartonella bacilliformis]AMG85757.1 outer membrane protein assembly factor BamE [Bartonella bacilliformis]EKS44542.1 SmpA/OmlA family outer membrane protein [Bartonella bacilliformis INS]EYS89824.1 hypothetical protein X472_00266 [Bartonella bacilliformis San Pedro600-02]EYS95166.1 hypothetical protein X470_00685 [Bartonella bacilliformis Peru-18]KEG17838.1 hypothetical protein H709_00577 [Bartonella bacilliformis CUSCO5]